MNFLIQMELILILKILDSLHESPQNFINEYFFKFR